VRAALRQAGRGLRLRRRRAVLGAIGIALAAAMLSAAVVVSFGLGTGFDRAAAAAGLPEIIARFHSQPAGRIAARIRELPDLARFSLRYEATNVGLSFADHSSASGVAEVLDTPGRDQGYALIAGRNLPPRGSDVLVERGLADAWGIGLGDTIQVQGLGPERVVGFAEGPDDVGYPLAAPRIYLSRPALERRFGAEPNPQVDLAEIWLRAPRYVDQVLAQAREVSYGLTNLQFATRGGVRVLLDQAAGIVIDLLVALSLIALLTAGVMLAASARAEVQRRLRALGVRRAVGETRAQVALAQGFEGLLIALPAASIGLAAGIWATYSPSVRLLTLLNEPPPGLALWAPLLGAWLAAVLLPALGAAWPAWRAAREPAVALLRGGELAGAAAGSAWRRLAGCSAAAPAPGRRPPLGRSPVGRRGGLTALGARLLAARRARLLATALTLGLSAGFVLLMLALAAELSTLETDPGALGKRYQLTASLPASAAARVRRIPGVEAVAPRYEVQAADSFALGETIDVIAYPGRHTVFEAPPLVAGRRLRGRAEAEVGAGLADALGLSPGSVLALALPGGDELRLRVSGVVSSLDHDGRVAYIPAAALLRDDPGASEQLAIVLAPGADQNAVDAALTRLGAPPSPATGATARGAPLVDVLRTILRAVAIVDGLVCLYALIQACALTVFERRRTLAVLRACGAGRIALARLLAGVVAMLLAPAAIIGISLERLVFGPILSRLAASYATLPLAAGGGEVAAVLAGLLAAGVLAVVWVTRSAARQSVLEGLAG
jgi:ABC-type antimicrobial peptide transport system permease subunit